MEYKLKPVIDGENENKVNGWKLYESERGTTYEVLMRNGTPDPTTWASLLPYYPFERDMPIFTREYCEYEGYDRPTFDTITIIN